MNSELLYPLCALVSSIIATLIIMPFLLDICKKRGLYDMPNERKVHANKIPRLGGVVFAPAMLIGICISLGVMAITRTTEMPTFKMSTLAILSGMFLIYCIGVLDDVLGLNARFKFMVQFVAALFMPLCGLYLNNLYGFMGIHEIPIWVSYPLSIFISLLVVNSINLIDGIDGLASGLGLIALGVLFFSFYELHITIYTIFTAALMGTIMVFMYFNLFGSVARNRKTFMGDTGSLILGYALAFLAFKYAMYNPNVLPYRADALLLAYTILIVPTFDLIRVALARLKNGVSIFHADKTHIHHKFMAIGFSMRTTLYLILGLQIGFCIANSVMYKLGISSTIIVAFDVLVFCGLHFYLNQRIKKN